MKLSFVTRTSVMVLFYASFVVAILTATQTAGASEVPGAAVATEPFYGQLIIALIAAVPPTGMMVVAFVALSRGQQQMKIALDGKLDKLMTAEKGVSKAEGVKEEREDQRARSDSSIAKVEIIQSPENPVPVVPVPDKKKDARSA